MSFGAPALFWGLLALLPLAAVYFIRVKPRRQAVNAYFLWQHVFKEKPVNSFFQKLRNLLSLLLLALAFFAAVMALTRPSVDTGDTSDLLIVIDRSASMSGVDEGKSRLERAKETAKDWIAALGGSRRAAIADVAAGLEFRAHLTGHARVLMDAVDAIQPSEEALDPNALAGLEIPGQDAENGETGRTRVIFLTDRRSPETKLPPGVEILDLGGAAHNAGITGADLRWDGPGRARLFVSLISDFPEEREVELELTRPDDASVARLFTTKIPVRGTKDESLLVENVEPGNWTLRLAGEDALAIDNVAPLGLNAPRPIPVRVAAKNSFFFDQVVAAFSRAQGVFTPVTEGERLTLAEGSAPAAPYAIVFSPSGESPFWKDLGDEIPAGPPEVTSADHPLISHFDPLLLLFDGARKLSAPPGAVVVLKHADGTPLLYTASAEGKSAVVMNFDPARSEFFLSPWFPVLIHDAATLLTGRSESFPSALPTGGVVEIPGNGPVESASMTGLVDGAATDLPAASPALLERVAGYQFTRDHADWRVGGAVFSSGESGPAPQEKLPEPARPASGWPLSIWLLLAAVLAVLGEELLYHRRKVG